MIGPKGSDWISKSWKWRGVKRRLALSSESATSRIALSRKGYQYHSPPNSSSISNLSSCLCLPIKAHSDDRLCASDARDCNCTRLCRAHLLATYTPLLDHQVPLVASFAISITPSCHQHYLGPRVLRRGATESTTNPPLPLYPRSPRFRFGESHYLLCSWA